MKIETIREAINQYGEDDALAIWLLGYMAAYGEIDTNVPDIIDKIISHTRDGYELK